MRRRGIVIALHPDEAMRPGHRFQTSQFAGGQAACAIVVVEAVAECQDDAGLIMAQQPGEAVERRVRVPRRQQLPAARVRRTFFQVQV